MFKLFKNKEALFNELKQIDFAAMLLWWTIFAIGFNSIFAFFLYPMVPFQIVQKGMPEDEVVKRMTKIGAKLDAIYKKGDRLKEPYNQLLKKPILHKLYIYEKGGVRGFYWINAKGIVDYVLVVGED